MEPKRIFTWAAILLLVLMSAFPTVGLLAAEGSTNATDSEEMPSVQYELSINSTEGGSVTEPGEGVFLYGEGTAVDLGYLDTNLRSQLFNYFYLGFGAIMVLIILFLPSGITGLVPLLQERLAKLTAGSRKGGQGQQHANT